MRIAWSELLLVLTLKETVPELLGVSLGSSRESTVIKAPLKCARELNPIPLELALSVAANVYYHQVMLRVLSQSSVTGT